MILANALGLDRRKGPLEAHAVRDRRPPGPHHVPESSGATWGYFRGAERDRTVGLLNAIEALSQLSYSPDTDFRRHGLN